MTLEMLSVVALGLAALGFLIRARLLFTESNGWPAAHWPVRWGLGGLAGVTFLRAIELAVRPGAQGNVSPSEAAVYLALSVYSTVLALNLIIQRSPRLMEQIEAFGDRIDVLHLRRRRT